MQSAGARAKLDVSTLRIIFPRPSAVPNTSPAVDAFIPVEYGHAPFAWSNRLAGTSFDTNLRSAVFAQMGIKKEDVIGGAGRRLDFASQE